MNLASFSPAFSEPLSQEANMYSYLKDRIPFLFDMTYACVFFFFFFFFLNEFDLKSSVLMGNVPYQKSLSINLQAVTQLHKQKLLDYEFAASIRLSLENKAQLHSWLTPF